MSEERQKHLAKVRENMTRGDHNTVPAPKAHAEGIPNAIIEQVLAMGPVEWGATAEQQSDQHVDDFRETLRMTREAFDYEDVPVRLHGLYLEGTETVLCHTGTSPNSGMNAQALAGAWNWLHEQCAALAAHHESQPAHPAPKALHPVLVEIMAEVEKATRKFPTWPTRIIDAGNVVSEEAGELAKACLQVTYEPHKETLEGVRMEAIQTAAMAFRFLCSMDRYDCSPAEQHEQAPL